MFSLIHRTKIIIILNGVLLKKKEKILAIKIIHHKKNHLILYDCVVICFIKSQMDLIMSSYNIKTSICKIKIIEILSVC